MKFRLKLFSFKMVNEMKLTAELGTYWHKWLNSSLKKTIGIINFVQHVKRNLK